MAMPSPGEFNLASPGPDDLPADDKESSPLLDALEQMRSLCDQIEAEQMKGRTGPAAPTAMPDKDEE